MAKRKDFHKVVVGRFELMQLVDHDTEVPVKIDTGAYRSSIHADNIIEREDGVLCFALLKGHERAGSKPISLETSEYTRVEITNSFGHSTERYEVKLKVKIGPRVFKGSFTLADRSANIFPVLIGRKILNDRFVVDTSYSAIDRKSLKDSSGINMPPDEEDEDKS